ncbi:MAG: hypothetical protein J6Y32_07105 [Bacteroidales bacterium]|nr:hypothetical protein [Bacteroidales bacterium]
MKLKHILLLFITIALVSCSRSTMLSNTTWYGGEFRLTFGSTTVTLEDLSGYPKLGGTYIVDYPTLSIAFNSYTGTDQKTTYGNTVNAAGKIKNDVLYFYLNGDKLVFAKETGF